MRADQPAQKGFKVTSPAANPRKGSMTFIVDMTRFNRAFKDFVAKVSKMDRALAREKKRLPKGTP